MPNGAVALLVLGRTNKGPSDPGTKHLAQMRALYANRFQELPPMEIEADRRLKEAAHHLTFGILCAQPIEGAGSTSDPGTPGFLIAQWLADDCMTADLVTPPATSRLPALDALCLRALRGQPLNRAELKCLHRLAGRPHPWARRVVVGASLAAWSLARARPKEAALALSSAAEAYLRLDELRRRQGRSVRSPALGKFANWCRETLSAFEPPIAARANPVRTLCEVAQQLKKPPRPAPRQTIDALDAVITAGQGVGGVELERRVVKQLARMLGARVLFHRRDGRYLARQPQSTHTLSSWTMLRLARTEGVRARKIRRRPEFWRPEQRRPRGVLSFPIGGGRACIERSTPFRAREIKAVRTVLRFVRERCGEPGSIPAAAATTRAASQPPQFRGLIGSSKPWKRILEQVWKVAPAACPVLLQGETGTGKELLARAVHLASKRARGPFVAMNCAAIHAETMHSELFGHIRGAFTGADRNRRGLMQQAHRGTLFLDELGDMPPEMQVALLRALEQRAVRPVGSARERPADVRIVAATNQDLEARVAAGAFREDLYHRVNVITIHLPPLRERLDDLPSLAGHILGRMDPPRRIRMEALGVLARYRWPGNVRELDNVLRAAALLSDEAVVGPEIVSQVLASRRQTASSRPERLAPRAEAVLRLLRGGWRSAPQLATRLGVSTRTVNRELRRLEEGGLILTSGHARARRYRCTQDERRDSSGNDAR